MSMLKHNSEIGVGFEISDGKKIQFISIICDVFYIFYGNSKHPLCFLTFKHKLRKKNQT